MLNELSSKYERVADVCRTYHIRELSIFGSALREDFRADSDIDLLVEFEEGATIGFLALGAIEQEFEALFGRNVDVVLKRSLRPVLKDAILESAKVLYDAA